MTLATLYKQITQCAVISAVSIASLGAFQAQAQTCTATAITPFINVNGTGWQQTASATVSSGSSVIFGPQAVLGAGQGAAPAAQRVSKPKP